MLKIGVMPKEALDHQKITAMKAPEKRKAIYDTVEKGLALRITPTGRKTFFYRYRFNGKNRRYTIGTFSSISLKNARNRVRELKVDVNRGIDPQAEKKKKKRAPQSLTFGDLAKEFKDKHLPTLRDSTRAEYKRIIDNELLPSLGKYPVSEIEKRQIMTLLDKKAYKDKSPTMANRIRARLSRIFTFGMERGLTDKNPVQLTSTYKEGENKRDRFYSKKEIKNLWKHFEKKKEPTQSVLKMLLICGQRKTETMKMQWTDIQGDVWTIPKEIAKNNKAHDVPLSSMAIEIIEKMRKINGKTDFVFCSPQKDNEPLAWLTRAREEIKEDSKVSDFRPHDLRRTVATYMAKLGIERTVLGKVLNHKSLAGDSQVTAIYDRHSYMEEKRKALQEWDSFLANILYAEDNN